MSLANSSTFCIRVAESRLCFVRRLRRPLRKPLRVVFTFYSPSAQNSALHNMMAHPESVGQRGTRIGLGAGRTRMSTVERKSGG